jgi:hypothetical protein
MSATADAAKRIWDEAQPSIVGTVAEVYLQSRGIAPLSPPPSCLRFATKLKHPNEQYFPALIIQPTHPETGAPIGGVQRIFLAWTGKGKAQVQPNKQKLSLGPIRGGVVKLAEPIDGQPVVVGEGIETVLSVMQAVGAAGFATLGTAGLKTFQPPDTIRHVIALGENDGGPNKRALDALIPTLIARGVRVDVAFPPPGLKDFNDCISGVSGHTPEAGLVLIKAAIEAAKSGVAAVADEPEKETKRKTPQADLLIQLAKEQCEFFHDEFGATYATLRAPHNGGTHRETHKLKSKSLRLWLLRAYYLSTGGGVPNDNSIRATIAMLEAFARFDGPQREVFVRRAAFADKLYIDLCDERWRAVEISADGWRIVDEPPAFFIRSSGMLALPEPKQCNPKIGIERLRSLLRVRDDEDFVIIVAFLLDALGGRGPHTVIFFTGEPGATKTTHLKLLRSLFDPNANPARSPPRELRDVYIAATRGAVLAYNNLSSLPGWLSDALCVVTEGSSDSRRELYSDDEESIIFARAPAMLTAVENVIARGDLADRTLYATLAPVPPSERKDEADFWKLAEAARPEILGALLTGLSEGLRRLPTLKTSLPRMATFAKFAAACETAFWPEGTFLAAYEANAENAVEDVLEADVAVSAFRAFIADRDQWTGTITELLEALVEHIRTPERDAASMHRKAVGDRDPDAQILTVAALREAQQRTRDLMSAGWPKKPHVLSGRLKKSGPQLRKIGIAIEWPTNHHRRIITIKSFKKAVVSGRASQASQASQSSSGNNENNGLENLTGTRGDAHRPIGDASGTLREHGGEHGGDGEDERDAVWGRSGMLGDAPAKKAQSMITM